MWTAKIQNKHVWVGTELNQSVTIFVQFINGLEKRDQEFIYTEEPTIETIEENITKVKDELNRLNDKYEELVGREL